MNRLPTLLITFAVALCGLPALTQAAPISIVAAENFYGDIAHQIAGDHATIHSIMSNPDQDPHLFEASPSVARELAAAQIVVTSGADYDPWMDKLLAATKAANRQTLVVADLVGKKSGDNPHIWYDPATMPAYASALTKALIAVDPSHRSDYESHLTTVLTSLAPIKDKAAALHQKYAGLPVTATEPVFGYMADALGLAMRNERFQLAVMNDTEPAASDVAAFENDLNSHTVKLFIYNSQASDTAAKRLLNMAKANHVPVIGVTETEPKGLTYETWMVNQLDALDKALSK